jgi:hypothetical protein
MLNFSLLVTQKKEKTPGKPWISLKKMKTKGIIAIMNSDSYPDLHSMAAWIRIRIQIQKASKELKGRNAAKRQKPKHKKFAGRISSWNFNTTYPYKCPVKYEIIKDIKSN